MPEFSQISKDKLSLAHPDLQLIFNEVIKYFDCTIADTYRTKAAQHKFLLDGLSEIDYPTVHNTKPSFAVDCVPFVAGNTCYKPEQAYYFAGFVLAIAEQLLREGKITHKVRNGADWGYSDHWVYRFKFKDPCHLELIPFPGEKMNYCET
jgi:peptidoglycan LD-endopeptidase CwlK